MSKNKKKFVVCGKCKCFNDEDVYGFGYCDLQQKTVMCDMGCSAGFKREDE